MAQSAGGEAGTHLAGTGTDCAGRDGTPSVPGHELSGVVEGARRGHPGTHEAPRDSGARPGGQQEPVVRVRLAVGLDDHVLGRPQPGDGGLPAQSDGGRCASEDGAHDQS